MFVPALRVQPPEEDAKMFQSFGLHLAAGAEDEVRLLSRADSLSGQLLCQSSVGLGRLQS